MVMSHPTDMVHVTVTFEDTFSFAKAVRQATVSRLTFDNMQKQVGQIVIDRFNKQTQIHETLRLISVTANLTNDK